MRRAAQDAEGRLSGDTGGAGVGLGSSLTDALPHCYCPK